MYYISCEKYNTLRIKFIYSGLRNARRTQHDRLKALNPDWATGIMKPRVKFLL